MRGVAIELLDCLYLGVRRVEELVRAARVLLLVVFASEDDVVSKPRRRLSDRGAGSDQGNLSFGSPDDAVICRWRVEVLILDGTHELHIGLHSAIACLGCPLVFEATLLAFIGHKSADRGSPH